MHASSQNLPGALPPESPYDPRPLQAAVASYASVVPVPAGPATPVSPDVQAATGVLTAAMEQGHTAPVELAQAERDAGILFDPQRAQDIADAAREQARTEYAAELQERGEQLAVVTDRARNLKTALAERKRTLEAILRLCEGRPATHHLPVGAILDAAAHARTPYDTAPMTLEWNETAGLKDGARREAAAIVECTTVYGGRADLVLPSKQRHALASLLQLEVRDIHAKCPTEGCGTVDDYDASDPSMAGWARVEVALIDDDGPRWYCSPACISNALGRAAAELAAADQLAAIDPDEQAPVLLIPEAATGWDAVSDDLDRRYGPGASDEYALQQAEAMEAAFEDERGDDGDGGW